MSPCEHLCHQLFWNKVLFFGPISGHRFHAIVAFSQIPFSKYVCELGNKRSLTWYRMYTPISNISECILLSVNHWHSFLRGCAWSWRSPKVQNQFKEIKAQFRSVGWVSSAIWDAVQFPGMAATASLEACKSLMSHFC